MDEPADTGCLQMSACHCAHHEDQQPEVSKADDAFVLEVNQDIVWLEVAVQLALLYQQQQHTDDLSSEMGRSNHSRNVRRL